MDDGQNHRFTWSELSILDKATLIAQISAPIALLATVFFSWLSWSEAKRSSEIQKDMFVAQNAPTLNIVRLSVSEEAKGTEVFLYAKNVGSSTALSVCLEAFLGKDDTGFMLTKGCAGENRLTVNVNGTQFVGAVPVTATEGRFDRFRDYRLMQDGDELFIGRAVYVRAIYDDVFDNRYSVSSVFLGVPK